jgi:hypothetical protein
MKDGGYEKAVSFNESKELQKIVSLTIHVAHRTLSSINAKKKKTETGESTGFSTIGNKC